MRRALVASAAAARGVRGSLRRARAWAAETQRSGSRWLSRRTSASKARRSPAQPSRKAAISRAHSGWCGSTRTRASSSGSSAATSRAYRGDPAASDSSRSTSERNSSSITSSTDVQRIDGHAPCGAGTTEPVWPRAHEPRGGALVTRRLLSSEQGHTPRRLRWPGDAATRSACRFGFTCDVTPGQSPSPLTAGRALLAPRPRAPRHAASVHHAPLPHRRARCAPTVVTHPGVP